MNQHARKKEENKSRFEKKKFRSAFLICRKNKAVFVADPQKEKQIKNGFFYCQKEGDAECGRHKSKQAEKIKEKIIWKIIN